MYEIVYTGRFKRSLKRCAKRGLPINKLIDVVNILQRDGSLPEKYKPHRLEGKYKDCWECHINPDWLLIWEQHETELLLIFIDTGTHSDLF